MPPGLEPWPPSRRGRRTQLPGAPPVRSGLGADADLVCTIVDWEMDPLPGVLTAAEILQVRDGTIVRGELIYDAEDLRQALAAARPQ